MEERVWLEIPRKLPNIKPHEEGQGTQWQKDCHHKNLDEDVSLNSKTITIIFHLKYFNINDERKPKGGTAKMV